MSNHRQAELNQLPKQSPSAETVASWQRQFEKLWDDAKSRGDGERLERLRMIHKIMG